MLNPVEHKNPIPTTGSAFTRVNPKAFREERLEQKKKDLLEQKKDLLEKTLLEHKKTLEELQQNHFFSEYIQRRATENRAASQEAHKCHQTVEAICHVSLTIQSSTSAKEAL